MASQDDYDRLERGYPGTPTPLGNAPMSMHAGAIHSRVVSHPSHTRNLSHSEPYDHDRKDRKPLSIESIGRAIVSRFVRGVRRGNLPFMIVFLTALFVFFGALAGIGYVDPDAQTQLGADSEFVVGGPVFDPAEGKRLREIQLAEQRALERQWQRNRRPNSGLWMKKARNDGAVRVADPKRKKSKQQAVVHEEVEQIIDPNAAERERLLQENFVQHDDDGASIENTDDAVPSIPDEELPLHGHAAQEHPDNLGDYELVKDHDSSYSEGDNQDKLLDLDDYVLVRDRDDDSQGPPLAGKQQKKLNDFELVEDFDNEQPFEGRPQDIAPPHDFKQEVPDNLHDYDLVQEEPSREDI